MKSIGPVEMLWLTTSPGFDHDRIVVASVSHLSRAAGERDPQEVRRELRDRLAALPDVVAVAQARVVPLRGSGFWNESIRVEGAPPPKSKMANFNLASCGLLPQETECPEPGCHRILEHRSRHVGAGIRRDGAHHEKSTQNVIHAWGVRDP